MKDVTKNKNRLNKKDIKVSIVLTLLSTIGIITLLLGQVDAIPEAMLVSTSKEIIILVSLVQTMVMVFITGFVGVKLARATNFNKGILGRIYSEEKEGIGKRSLDKRSVVISLIISFLCAAIMTLGDKFIWGPFIPEVGSTIYTFDPLYLLSGIFYGGVAEEVMLRLFMTSLIVFILYKIFARKKDKTQIPAAIYCIAIIVAAILFGLGHLPATLGAFSIINFAVISRMIILNAIPGIFFGYLYWKKGLEYAIISHMFIHVFNQLILLPLVF